jgi:DNA excision repair protein ERCC-6
MLLHSGYHSVPKRKMLWELKPDSQNLLVSGAIRRDQVDQVLQCLHFRDNTLLDGDGYFKVRPIINNLNKSSKWFLGSGQYSVDEVMIPYFGRHGSKQYIHGKPIRYGYKVRCTVYCTVLENC